MRENANRYCSIFAMALFYYFVLTKIGLTSEHVKSRLREHLINVTSVCFARLNSKAETNLSKFSTKRASDRFRENEE